MFTAVCYDISDDRRRARLSRVLADFGRRVQLSVFEADLSQERFERLLLRLRRLVHPGEDRIRVYRLCEACRARVVVVSGMPPYTEPPAVVVTGGPTTPSPSRAERPAK